MAHDMRGSSLRSPQTPVRNSSGGTIQHIWPPGQPPLLCGPALQLAAPWLLEYNRGRDDSLAGAQRGPRCRSIWPPWPFNRGIMPTLRQSMRHLRRYQQIARILTRYGFGYVLTQLGIGMVGLSMEILIVLVVLLMEGCK